MPKKTFIQEAYEQLKANLCIPADTIIHDNTSYGDSPSRNRPAWVSWITPPETTEQSYVEKFRQFLLEHSFEVMPAEKHQDTSYYKYTQNGEAMLAYITKSDTQIDICLSDAQRLRELRIFSKEKYTTDQGVHYLQKGVARYCKRKLGLE